ncbi:hypothetical protein [Winogradskyella jejuensis]|uniref:Lipoprotein n=1 Tax=Winogradskyella jejuensis TaxID=1089305 RepID=A0A1M5MCL0_9FLAO|nr:hypothetical protein [Winogradskyella jejuensis]SHG75018.1 hypothetical protein SAMN05444148_0863 [Winogradskyella jejuensis]
MKTKYIIPILALTLLASCGDKAQNNSDIAEEASSKERKEISAKAIENFKYNDYILSGDAEKEVQDWSRFKELETQVSYLKKADITFFTSEKDTLKAFLDSLKVSIPQSINTKPVNARITALETKLLKLNNDLTLDNYSVENKLSSIKDLLIANSNLIFVINKKLEFDKNDVGRPEDE